MPWLREGECPPEVCQGRCCTHVGVWFNDSSPEIRPFLTQQQIRGNSVKGKDGSFLLDIAHRCQHLTDAGLCGLHPSMNPSPALPKRPEFCSEWPTEPSQLVNDTYCGFSFRWVEEELGVT